jgi:hypothetical protein
MAAQRALAEEPDMRQRGSRKGGLIAIAGFLLILFLILPVFPWNVTTVAGPFTVTIRAQTSFSYAVFKCGVVSDPTVGGLAYGNSYPSLFKPWSGGEWVCGSNARFNKEQ